MVQNDGGIEVQRSRFQEFVEEPRKPPTNAHLAPQRLALLVPDELLTSRVSPFQPHRALQALSPAVVHL